MRSGSDFIALVRLTSKRGEVLARPGDSCARVPSTSLEWLERAGKIRRDSTIAPIETPAPDGEAGEIAARPRLRKHR